VRTAFLVHLLKLFSKKEMEITPKDSICVSIMRLSCAFLMLVSLFSTPLRAAETATPAQPSAASTPQPTESTPPAVGNAAPPAETSPAEGTATETATADVAPTEAVPAETSPAETTAVAPQPIAVAPQPIVAGPDSEYSNLPSLRRPRPRKGMMIAGWGVFGGMYLFSMLVGGLMLSGGDSDPNTTCTNCDDVGPKLFIPIVGPFLAIPGADGTDGKVVVVILGIGQLAGISLAIAGTVRYSIQKKRFYAKNTNPYIPHVDVAYTGRSEDSPILRLGWTF
jgi:hypothetical protein